MPTIHEWLMASKGWALEPDTKTNVNFIFSYLFRKNAKREKCNLLILNSNYLYPFKGVVERLIDSLVTPLKLFIF